MDTPSILDQTVPSTNGTEKPAQVAPDPFDVGRLKLTQDFAATLGVKKALITMPVRKPSKEWFVQAHPLDSYRMPTAVVELKEDRETYLVAPDLWHELTGEATFSPRLLVTAINRQKVLFLWPIRLPGEDGKLDDWSRSALEAVGMATKNWVRISANMSLGAYEVFTATGDLPQPEWPEQTFQDLLRIAFKNKMIDTIDHPVLRRLRGEA